MSSGERCLECPMRCVPDSRLGRLFMRLAYGKKLPAPPSSVALANCDRPVELKKSEVLETPPGPFSVTRFGIVLEGICQAEQTKVSYNSLGNFEFTPVVMDTAANSNELSP